MPTPLSRTRVVRATATVLLLVPAIVLAGVNQAAANPRSVPGDLRVMAPEGASLAQHTQYTGTTGVRTSPRADCFGDGTGGSGDRVKVEGSTALGILADGRKADGSLRPLLVSDHFDFGLALCGIGRAIAPQSGYWYLKVNHEGSQTGGDLTRVRRGDEILWYLIEDFNEPVPSELALSAPARAEEGESVTVKVLSYADDGTRSPAVGATVSGATAPTGPDGTTTVTPDEGLTKLRASRPGSIDSNRDVICVPDGEGCPAGYEVTIAGSPAADRIKGSRRAEEILAGAGADAIRRVEAGDAVDCGGGRDRVTLERGAGIDADRCERIKRR